MKNMIFLILAALGVACGGEARQGREGGELTRRQAESLANQAWRDEAARIEAEWGSMWDAQRLELRDLRMPLFTAIYGAAPSDGRSLWISMHGGGATAPAANDEQWENQKTLYAPAEGVYVAPRAAVDDWNMWFRPFVDTLFGAIIRTTIVRLGVNPNKVYVMGYSAGGDGVYRLAPRMADRWAAAAMMAGHPGDTSPLNLRNTPFSLWMGALDNAYDRNSLAVAYSARLDSLHAADPGGYVHETHIEAGKGHWMDNADTLALDWMAPRRRNPYPDRVVWRQEASSPRAGFYWLAIPPDDKTAGRESRVERNGNTITIVRNDHPTLWIELNDRVVDLDRPVKVVRDGLTIFEGRVPRRAQHIRRSARERGDPDYIFSARLEITASGVHPLPRDDHYRPTR
jgi:predicted esterase